MMMNLWWSITLMVVLHFSKAAGAPVNILLRATPRNQQQLEFIKDIETNRQNMSLEFWRSPDIYHQHTDFWVSKSSLEKLKPQMKSAGLDYEVVIKNNRSDTVISADNVESYDSTYQKVEGVLSEIERLAAAHRDLVSTKILGKSTEGRPILSVHIKTKGGLKYKQIVFVVCGSHAREWLAIASCLYVLRKIVFDHQYDDKMKAMLHRYEFVMVPLLNPDGYEFTMKDDRMWRKSRSKTKDENCMGVDINRNWGYRWGGGGSSQDPCEEIYCGEMPFSERESLALGRYLYKLRRRIAAFIDVHTFGQLWMSPWGFTQSHPYDFARQEQAMMRIQESIQSKSDKLYQIGRACSTLYQSSGTSLDWVYGKLGILHTYTVELRPIRDPESSLNGFRVHYSTIIPTGTDLLEGLKALVSFMAGEYSRG